MDTNGQIKFKAINKFRQYINNLKPDSITIEIKFEGLYEFELTSLQEGKGSLSRFNTTLLENNPSIDIYVNNALFEAGLITDSDNAKVLINPTLSYNPKKEYIELTGFKVSMHDDNILQKILENR